MFTSRKFTRTLCNWKKKFTWTIELTPGFVRLQQLDREATIEIDQQYQSLENS